MKDFLIENLAGMCRYNCKWDRLSGDACTVCVAAERLTNAEAQLRAKDEALTALKAERDRLRSALVGLVGVDGKDDLEQMEVVMRMTPAPAEDKAVTIDAIHALIVSLP
jgi:hypothetical protein